MIILGVPVQGQNSDLLHGKLATGPNLGDIERIEIALGGLLGLHDLDEQGPFEISTGFDRLVQLSLGVIRVFTTHDGGFLESELSDFLLRLPVVLNNVIILIRTHSPPIFPPPPYSP
jgi:hypothetical protein